MPGRTCSAMPAHGLLSLKAMKSAILSGPKKTVAA